jgi:hypothetical protein
MAFNQNIPLPRDKYYISQGDMLDNFQDTFLVTNVNHSRLTTVIPNANQGKHTSVGMPIQSRDPALAPITLANEGAVYSNLGESTRDEGNTAGVVWRRESNGTIINFTDGDTFNATIMNTPVSPQPLLFFYWNRLPSGALVKIWTFFAEVNDGTSNITVNTFDYTPQFYKDFSPPFATVNWGSIDVARNIFIDPTAADADPNVVLYPSSFTTTQFKFSAITRNLEDKARQDPKRTIVLKLIVIGT